MGRSLGKAISHNDGSASKEAQVLRKERLQSKMKPAKVLLQGPTGQGKKKTVKNELASDISCGSVHISTLSNPLSEILVDP